MAEAWHRDRVAVVTGGSTGIGLAIAEVLARRGARVAVGARGLKDRTKVQVVQDRLGDGAMASFLDVRGQAAVDAFLVEVHKRLGQPSILVNAAGISAHQTISGHKIEDWQAVLDVNLTGPFRMIRACLPGMMAGGWGRIVNIASTAAVAASAHHPAYCASKSGLVGLTRAAALEGAPHGVTAIAVSPTWVETDMLRQSARLQAERAGHSYGDEIAALAASNPQNRLVQASEIAELVSFACSDLARGLTMEDIQINAGAHW